jgi:hypothetical protein
MGTGESILITTNIKLGATNMLDYIKKKFTKKPTDAQPEKKAHRVKKKSAKDEATDRGEPYVSVLTVELDPENVGNGAFELDWNDIFVAKLVRAGFQGKTDNDIVDRWFQTICKNIISENYEQWEANQPVDARPRMVDRKDIGGGRSEVS